MHFLMKGKERKKDETTNNDLSHNDHNAVAVVVTVSISSSCS